MNAFYHHSAFSRSTLLRYFLFIAVVIGLAMWQLTLFQYTLKWDAIDITLPWRYFTSDALRHQILPLWNPYQHLGFAQGTIPETWYPIGLVLGVLRTYDAYSLNIEYIIHLGIASFGFFQLATTMGIEKKGALWGALVFPLSGFFVGNAQHTGWIVAGAWIPLVLSSFLHFLKTFQWKWGFLFALYCFCLASGGYTAYTIITSYILVFLFGRHIYLLAIEGHIDRSIWIQTGRLLVITLLLSATIVLCLLELMEHIDRGVGLGNEASVVGSLRIKHLVSLLLPFATVKGGAGFWQGDQSMINVYVGLLGLLFTLASLSKLHVPIIRNLWIAALVSLALALGEELPFRLWANHLPLFDLFRFPSLFRYFTILAFILIGAQMLSTGLSGDQSSIKQLITRGLFWGAVLCSIIAVGLVLIGMRTGHFVPWSIDTPIVASLLQAGWHAGILWIAYALVRTVVTPATLFRFIMILTAIDMVGSCQLNGPVSIFSQEKLESIQSNLTQLPKGYPTPILQDPLGSNADHNLHTIPLYRNTNTFYKRIGRDGYTPFQYNQYIEMEHSPLLEKSLNMPAFFLSKLVPPTQEPYYTSYPRTNPGGQQIQIKSYRPNQIVLQTNAEVPTVLVYNQNNQADWTGSMDGRPLKRLSVDVGLLGFWLPEGQHEVQLSYHPGRLVHALLLSLVLFLVLFTIVMIKTWKAHPITTRWALLCSIGLSCIYFRPVDHLVSLNLMPEGNVHLINQIDEIKVTPQKNAIIDRFLDKGDMPRFLERIHNIAGPFIYYERPLNHIESQVFSNYLRDHYVVTSDTLDQGYIALHCTLLPSLDNQSSINGFENTTIHWNRSNLAIEMETSGNRFQKLDTIIYSATFELETNDLIDTIIINLDLRSDKIEKSTLIGSFGTSNKTARNYRRPLSSPASDPEGKWVHQQHVITIDPNQQTAPQTIKIYIWNPTKESIDLDNFSVILKTFEK